MESRSYDYTTITVTRDILNDLNKVKSFIVANRNRIKEIRSLFRRKKGRKVRISNARVIEFLIYVFNNYYLNKVSRR